MTAETSSEPRAARLGRYEVLGSLGESGGWSGLGAVDPQKGRKIALRVLSIGGVPPDITSALLRDAQALSRIRHPNLLNAYEAGIDGDKLYVAHEAFTGIPLDRWMTARRRSWRDISRVFVSIGTGLAAIHATGMVLRELSASGILVGKDGRTVIADIGLARMLPGAPTQPAIASPEELAGRPRDQRSDQFALSVLLHQALYGFLPYDASGSWVRADLTGARSVPGPLAEVVDRGLAVEPEARFPAVVQWVVAVHALVEHRPQAPRVVAAALALALLSLAAGSTVGAWLRSGTPFASMTRVLAIECNEVDRSFGGTWDRARQDELARALWRGSGAEAASPWASVRRDLSAWVLRWGAVYDEVCLLSGNRTGDQLTADARTLDCLRGSRRRLETLLDATGQLGPRRTLVAVSRLGPPEACATETADVWIDGIRRAAAPAGATADALIAQAAMEWSDGAVQSAIGLLERAVAQFPDNAADERIATALANLGRLRAEAGMLEEAQATLTRAIRVRERVSGPDDASTAALWHDLGVVAARRGATAEAVLHHRRALGVRERVLGPTSLEVATSLRALGALERAAHRPEEAVESHRRALTISTGAVGEESGEAALAGIELGWALLDAGKAGEASERFTIAERTAQRLVGRASRLVARALEGRGVADLALGAPSKAVVALEEAVFILESSGGGADQLARTKFHLATALVAEGKDLPRARRLAAAAHDRLIDGRAQDPSLAGAVSAWTAQLGSAP